MPDILPNLCQKHAKLMPQICQTYAKHMSNLCWTNVWFMPTVCCIYAKCMPELCLFMHYVRCMLVYAIFVLLLLLLLLLLLFMCPFQVSVLDMLARQSRMAALRLSHYTYQADRTDILANMPSISFPLDILATSLRTCRSVFVFAVSICSGWSAISVHSCFTKSLVLLLAARIAAACGSLQDGPWSARSVLLTVRLCRRFQAL